MPVPDEFWNFEGVIHADQFKNYRDAEGRKMNLAHVASTWGPLFKGMVATPVSKVESGFAIFETKTKEGRPLPHVHWFLHMTGPCTRTDIHRILLAHYPRDTLSPSLNPEPTHARGLYKTLGLGVFSLRERAARYFLKYEKHPEVLAEVPVILHHAMLETPPGPDDRLRLQQDALTLEIAAKGRYDTATDKHSAELLYPEFPSDEAFIIKGDTNKTEVYSQAIKHQTVYAIRSKLYNSKADKWVQLRETGKLFGVKIPILEIYDDIDPGRVVGDGGDEADKSFGTPKPEKKNADEEKSEEEKTIHKLFGDKFLTDHKMISKAINDTRFEDEDGEVHETLQYESDGRYASHGQWIDDEDGIHATWHVEFAYELAKFNKDREEYHKAVKKAETANRKLLAAARKQEREYFKAGTKGMDLTRKRKR